MPVICNRPPMITSPVDMPIQHFVYPFQVLFLIYVTIRGLLQMRYGQTRIVAKRSLLLLASVDFLLLLTMLPNSLATYALFYENESYRRFMHYTKITINAWSNFFSACEVFLTVAICLECYLRARASSLSRWFDSGIRYWSMIGVFVLLAFWSAGYHFFLYSLVVRMVCNGDKMASKLIMNPAVTPGMVKFFNLQQSLIVIIIPCILVAFLNRKLATILKEGKLPVVNNECLELVSNEATRLDRPKCLRRLAIVTIFFVLSHVLSFAPFIYDIFPSIDKGLEFKILISVMNSILVTGKLATLLLLFDSCRDLVRTGFY